MTKFESIVKTVLEQLKLDLASETWESRRRYFNQMLRFADSLGVSEPCQELFDAFIADDNGSRERRALHVRCVRLVDALAGSRAKDERGILFNEPPMPSEANVREYFKGREFPATVGVRVDFIIFKAEVEMRSLSLTASTMGQYKHSWMDIRRYFDGAGASGYDEAILQGYIQKTNDLRSDGSIEEWKWKINRKAAHVLMVASKNPPSPHSQNMV